MKKVLEIITISVIIIFTIITLSNYTFATTLRDLDKPASDQFNKVGNKMITSFTAVGMVVSVVTLIIIGIKYMIGSIEDRANYKKSMLPYVIGAGLVFSASAIAQIIYNFTKNL